MVQTRGRCSIINPLYTGGRESNEGFAPILQQCEGSQEPELNETSLPFSTGLILKSVVVVVVLVQMLSRLYIGVSPKVVSHFLFLFL